MGSELSIRYGRQMAIPEIGREGQEKIKNSKVLVIGAGALGSMVGIELAGAGVGRIGIADYDTIDISNLQRQFFFETEDCGKPKVTKISERINALNPEVEVTVYLTILTPERCEGIFREYDFIVDATDNPESKRMTGEKALKYGKACCIGGVRDFQGQVMTFLPGDSRFEEYFGEASADGFLPCSLGGVMGPAAALCASIQASEALKYITGAGRLLSGKLLLFNLLNNSFKTFTY